jgi:hypothetical protein
MAYTEYYKQIRSFKTIPKSVHERLKKGEGTPFIYNAQIKQDNVAQQSFPLYECKAGEILFIKSVHVTSNTGSSQPNTFMDAPNSTIADAPQTYPENIAAQYCTLASYASNGTIFLDPPIAVHDQLWFSKDSTTLDKSYFIVVTGILMDV